MGGTNVSSINILNGRVSFFHCHSQHPRREPLSRVLSGVLGSAPEPLTRKSL